MLDVTELFSGPEERSSFTFGDLWKDIDKTSHWLEQVFDGILKTPPRDFAIVQVSPCQFLYDPKALYSTSLLSAFSLRPDDATVSMRDFEYLFCDTFLDYFQFPENETELFVSWITKTLYGVPKEEEDLDFTPPDFIRDYLLYEAKHDGFLGRVRMVDQANFVPLFVSVLFAIHIGGLWPQLYDRIDMRNLCGLKPPFKLMEMFLNRFAERELRLRTVTVDDVTEVMRLFERFDIVHSDLVLQEEMILQALRLSNGPVARTLWARTRSAAMRFGRPLTQRRAGASQSESSARKRADGVECMELADA